MTETLHMAIEQLLLALEEEQLHGEANSGQLAVLRARLVADCSEALSGNGTEPCADDTSLLNDLAAYLEGLSSAEEREKFIAALAQRPQSRAALESAAAFLADLKREEKPVSAAVLNEAMALFGPAEHRAAGAAAMVPQPIWGKKFNWQAWGAMAALLLVGVIGSAHLWELGRMSAAPPVATSTPRTATPMTAAPMTAAPMAPEQSPSKHPPAAADREVPRALGQPEGDCNADVQAENSESHPKGAAALAGASRNEPVEAAGRTPCKSSSDKPSSHGPAAAPTLPNGQRAKDPSQETGPQPDLPMGNPH